MAPSHNSDSMVAPISPELFLDTPIVRCEDGEIIIFPKLKLVEIDGELLSRTDVLELASAFAQAIDALATFSAVTEVKETSSGWCIEVLHTPSIAINGEHYTPQDVERDLHSLNYALRLID